MRDRTTRFMAESRKKRMSPMAVIIGVIALMTVSAVGAVLLAPEPAHQIRERAEVERSKAVELDDRGKFKQALVAYHVALDILGGDDRFASMATDVRAAIKELKGRMAQRRALDRRFASLLTRVGQDDLRDQLDDALSIQNRMGEAEFSWRGKLDKRIATLEKEIRGPIIESFYEARSRISGLCKLGSDATADFKRAISLWKEYLGLKLREEDREKAEPELTRVERRAKGRYQKK